jgi:peptidoglycan/xylan/chitin deacetylase (PgdA/CDA1 family)
MTYAHRRARLVSISVPNNPTRIGVKPRVYRSPYWDFSPNTLSILEEYGFSADSSLMGNDFQPYVIRRVEVQSAHDFPARRLIEYIADKGAWFATLSEIRDATEIP